MQNASTRQSPESKEGVLLSGPKASPVASERLVRSSILASAVGLVLKSGWSKLYPEDERQSRGYRCRPACPAGSRSCLPVSPRPQPISRGVGHHNLPGLSPSELQGCEQGDPQRVPHGSPPGYNLNVFISSSS